MKKPTNKTGKPAPDNVYKNFAAEREEIMKHKWYKSEEAGKDIGFESALLDWVYNHRDTWRKKNN